ncbi:hypothetical protein BT63DRAFT_414230 [Microthyrium microscopicum]|uniref:K Homology domain-containing protein n=1 Tax=Microthyrium microscopicum TaxID=703497 RepID=A0A6A6U9C3_9PEZI|nr:hypothetical protein BT63DRAFT_414230 [Microthyrium microscopicum]
MQNLKTLAGGMRHGWDMQFGVRHQQPQSQHPHQQHHEMPRTQSYQRQQTPSITQLPPGVPMSWCFKVPFNNNLAGPEIEKVIYASNGAKERWSHPAGSPEDTPTHRLPVHVQHIEDLQKLCSTMKEQANVEASVTVGRATSLGMVPGLPASQTNNVVANVCLHGPQFDQVRRARQHILNSSPITMQSATVPVDRGMLFKDEQGDLPERIINVLDQIAKNTKADIFLLDPEERNEDGSSKTASKEPIKLVIYGDMLTKENAKVHFLIMIDQLLGMHVDSMTLDLNLHSLICGRARKKIKAIESATDTAIYFPPIFPAIHRYCPPGAERRSFDEIVITGPSQEHIFQAKSQLKDLTFNAKSFVKEVRITPTKMDHLLLERLDKIQSIMEAHASYLLLPSIGEYSGVIRVQGLDVLNVERTVRDVMGLTTQFYSAEWQCAPLNQLPPIAQIQSVLSDICASSGADIVFANMTFYAFGSDEACRTALSVISHIPFVKHAPSSIHVKLELAVEHKEFVSGKKNGKINKIMNTANVQIVFDGFNEYNFYIDVRGSDYGPTLFGLELVEMELPASLSFHVPDQYHKRIIGIGGQHIQQLMKKYSVFVKFSNAHDRGPVIGKEDDTLKLDNVICRTPSRNAQNLEMVKQEIMDMVNRPDAEQVTENVTIDRLLHRELLSLRMQEIDDLEKKWNCKITFPSTEQASDVVLVSGPEFQVPNAIYDLLAMVPETHDVTFPLKPELKEFVKSTEFEEIVEKLKSQYVVDLTMKETASTVPDQEETETLTLGYTRNDAGGLKDAIDFLISSLVLKGLDAETVKGSIPRPKSDSFEDSLPYFESKLLHRKDPASGTDSPTRSLFENAEGHESSGSSSFFSLSKFRKPTSMSSFSSFIDRRKNGANSPGGPFFKHASSNASKASLASLESQGSGYRNIWNDSGINLPEEEITVSTPLPHPNGHGWPITTPVSGPSHFPTPTTHPGPIHTGLNASTHPGFMFNNNSSSSLLLNFPTGLTPIPGDTTPTSRYDPRASVDSGRPSTSHSISGYPGHMNGHTR